MLSYKNSTVRTSVRRLVEFLLREGDICTGTALRSDVEAMQEGTRLHKKIQKSKGKSYRSEVPLKMSWQEKHPRTGKEYELVLEGRADGIEELVIDGGDPIRLPSVMIDEIKCVYYDLEEIEEPEPLHLAQAKCYACMLASRRELDEIAVRITYCHIETEEIRYLDQIFTAEDLSVWFDELIDRYRIWAEYVVEARDARQQSIEELRFPFDYRPGQKQMSAMVYHAIHGGHHLFLQAPTGTGKTISAIYPAVKEMGSSNCERIFYLTAKTITRTAAENTFHILADHRLRLHSLTITAKDRICILDTPVCDPGSCPRAAGHYDRINDAIYALLTQCLQITRETLLDYAQEYNVCPYELGFEAAAFCDCVICDYNYVFDPHVNVRGLSVDTDKAGNVLLIDEAHNFPDRAREMYSADLKKEELTCLRKYFQEKNPWLAKRTAAVIRKLKSPDSMELSLIRLLEPLEEYLKDHPELEDREEIVRIYFGIRHFYMILGQINEGYEVYSSGEGRSFVQHLFCVDPSACIEEYLDKARAAIFFSATLLPINYYRRLLGGRMSVDAFSIPSPFDKGKRLLMIAGDVTSRYSRRGEEQYKRIVGYLKIVVKAKKGNYMIFFPSYEMMTECLAIARTDIDTDECDLIVQTPSMNEEEKESFLRVFSEGGKDSNRALIGFCVLGSFFSEGIDLTGDRLIGVLVVGTGLPKICKEREVIRKFFDNKGKKGYDYAYRYPGMNRVLQAAGRVIRTRDDRGLILLLDDRFLLHENQALLPEDWDSFYEVSLRNCGEVIRNFYSVTGD